MEEMAAMAEGGEGWYLSIFALGGTLVIGKSAFVGSV